MICFLAAANLISAASAQTDSGTGASSDSGNILTDLRDDVMALPTWENTYWLLGGAATTWGAYEIEDAEGARRALDGSFIDPFADWANVYGNLRVQVPLALSLWGYGRWQDDPEAAGVGYDFFRALSLNYAVTGVMKPTFNRTRPDGEDYSFPSGHASAVFTAAGVVSRHYGPGMTTFALGCGVLTGLGRMEDLKHYASDVTAGATLGWIIGCTVARHGPPKNGDAEDRAWRLSPQPGGVVLSRRF